MDVFDKRLIKWLISPEIEGNVSTLSGDRGGFTYKGLSSRIYPWIETSVRNGSITDADVFDVYYSDYLKTIYDYERLKLRFPWLVKLLFAGKVHGSGDEEYTSAVQTILNAFGYSLKVDGFLGADTVSVLYGLTDDEENTLKLRLQQNEAALASLRVESVGAYPVGIRNRVSKELSFAFGPSSDVKVDSVDQSTASNGDSYVVAHAKLSSVLAASNDVGLQVVSSSGWEQLPLGMDLTIEIRSVNHAFNPIPSREVSKPT